MNNFLESLQKKEEVVDEHSTVGYYSRLNLSYNCTDLAIKRNYEALLAQYSSESKKADTRVKESLELRLQEEEMQQKQQLIQKINHAYNVLGTKATRVRYIKEIEGRCYLSQLPSLEQLKQQQSDKIFPFYMFEVSKKTGMSSYANRIIKFDYINMVLEERKEDQPVKAYMFSSIQSASAGFKKDELYIEFTERKETKTHAFRVFHERHRNLILELLWFARDLAYYNLRDKQEKVRNPNIKEVETVQSSVQQQAVVTSLSGKQSSSSVLEHSSGRFSVLTNDRVVPPGELFKCSATRKSNGIFGHNKPCFLFIGLTQMMITWDAQGEHITSLIPVEQDCFTFTKLKDPGSFQLSFGSSKMHFTTFKPENVYLLEKHINQALNHKLASNNVYSSMPYTKRDEGVSVILQKSLNIVMNKISDKVKELEDLWNEKAELEKQLAAEEERAVERIGRKDICDVETPNELRQLLSLNKNDVRFATGRGVKSVIQSRNRTPEGKRSYEPVPRHRASQPPSHDTTSQKIPLTHSVNIDLRLNALQPTAHYQFSLDDDDVEEDEEHDDEEEEEKSINQQTQQKDEAQLVSQHGRGRDHEIGYKNENISNGAMFDRRTMMSDMQRGEANKMAVT